MPKASANLEETHPKDLKSCEGGHLEARRLTYGEKLQRRAMVSGMKVKAEKGKSDFEGEMNLISEAATVFDFQHCIISHNLTKTDDENDKFDFSKVADIRALDPRVGEEIDNWLSELNNFEDDEGN